MARRDNEATAQPGEEAPSRHLVVIGSSAGGIEALSILVSTLPPDFPAPVLIAQHLDPHRQSHLSEILARRSPLPVITVEEHATLAPGSVYVVPANRHIEVSDHEVRLTEDPRDGRPMPSVDLLLTTAADALGENLIAVILTGSGSDGAEGARRVKANGGTVLIQDPQTARYPSMPGSLAPTSVDIVASIEAIGPLLHDLVTGTYRPTRPDDDRVLTTFLDTLRQRSGIDFSSYKRPTILRRLQRRMAATRSERLRDYVRYVSSHPEEYARLTSSFLIKVTEFFRDPELFEHLRTNVLPQLIEEARTASRELRLWSAGCATGEESYSLAMLVHDALADEADDWTVRIFATDLDGDAVAFARRGTYPASSLEHLPPDIIDRHFLKLDGDYEVKPHIRSLVVYGQHDLAMRAPFPRTDLVLCRNVLIYFTSELQRRALQLFAFSLREGGWLVLGKAETTSPLGDYFVMEEARLKLFRRRGERPVIPPFRLGDPATMGVVASRQGHPALTPGLPAIDTHPRARALARAEATINALPVGVVSVSRAYDVESINPLARRLLSIHGAAIGQDLIHLADGVAPVPLRAAIDDALAGQTRTLTVESGAAGVRDGGAWIEITCGPAPSDDGEGHPSGAVIVVRDVTEDQRRLAGSARAAEEERGALAAMTSQLEGLRDGNRRITAANDELTTTNAELRVANEELLVSNEEVQAATEEVETLNEELQATNEELETLNEELQATVEELNTTNDDLQARTVELQQMTIDLDEQISGAERERARLLTLIENLSDAVLVVDRGGHTVIRNETFVRMFEVDRIEPRDEQGRVISLSELRERTAHGESLGFAFSVPREGGRRWFEASIRPVPAEMEIGGGGILVVHDTTDVSRRRLQEEFVGTVAHELRTPLTALRGYVQMLQRRTADSADPSLVGRIADQADRLHQLVDELFDITLADRGGITVHPMRLTLGPLVREIVEIARGIADGQSISIEEPDGELIVDADPGRIQQLLLNLLTNAMVHAAGSPEIFVRLHRLRRRAEIEIEDHGPGIARDVQARIFNRFERGGAVKPGGLGLGLYISREIVLAHGGTIDIDSEPGDGTTFTVRLPLAGKPGGERKRNGQRSPDAAATRAATRDDGNGTGDGRRPPGGDRARTPRPSHRKESAG